MAGRRARGGALGIATVLLISCATSVATVVAATPARALSNGLALTPPMGWNGFTRYGRSVTASLVEAQARALVSSGMAAAGYDYVNLDGGWDLKDRGPDDELVADPAKFPDGIKPVADYVHGLGLKFGIYTSAGYENCVRSAAGSYGHYAQDSRTFASWGVDFVKVDWCDVPVGDYPGETTEQVAQDLGAQFRDAIAGAGRPMIFDYNPNQSCPNNCEDWTWGAGVANIWRTAPDPQNNYASMLGNYTRNVAHFAYAGPGGWNDPGAFEIGNGGLSPIEERSEISLWAEMAAPMLAGNDLTTMTAADRDLLTNRAVIAVDQDPLGAQAHPVSDADGHWVLSRQISGGARAVVLFNQTDTPTTITTTAGALGLPAAPGYTVTDLWSDATSESAGTITARLPAHGSAMYEIAPTDDLGAHPPLAVLGLDAARTQLLPGSAVTLTATLTDDGRLPMRQVQLSAQPPAGWSVAASSPTEFATITPGQTVTATWQATVGPAHGCTAAPAVTLRYTWGSSSRSGAASAAAPVFVACQLSEAFDNTGISSDDDVDKGNLDGVDNSYSEQALADLGITPGATFTHDGLTFTWPDAPAGTPDNVAADGQLIAVAGSGDTLGFVGSEDHAGPVTGTGTIYYSDGSTSPFSLRLGRYFTSPPDPGELFQMPYYNSAGFSTGSKDNPYGQVQHRVYLFFASVPVTPGKTVAAVGLPPIGWHDGTGAKMHVFAMSLGSGSAG